MFDGSFSEDDVTAALTSALCEARLIGNAELARVQRLHRETGERIDIILPKLGLVSEADVAQALARCLKLPLAMAKDYPGEPVLEGTLSAAFLKDARIIPLADTEEALYIATADPLNRFALTALLLRTGKPVITRVGLPQDVEAAYDRLYGNGRSAIEQILDTSDDAESDDSKRDIEQLRDLASGAPVIRLVNLMLSHAVERRASDIHIEPFDRALRVRYRIDGVLREAQAPPKRLSAAVISRVKIMAKLNIAETRLPQDGRIKVTVRGKEIDLRISTVPALYGESVVMRLLDRSASELDLSALGMAVDLGGTYESMLRQPNGIVLVTGPTGSGKTTTLYASLKLLNSGERKILTVEDPVEYQLDGVNQVQAKPQIDLTFAKLLRAFLRQDPDVIMIGEIRDVETAEIAVQAALTGHLVLSTLHTNSAASTITRFLDMGVPDYLITSTLSGVVAQRLVRTLCKHCRQPLPELPAQAEQLLVDTVSADGPATFCQPLGCERCGGDGYRGRTAIHEVLVMSDTLRRLVLQRAEAQELEASAMACGMRSMVQQGMHLARAGITSIDEVMRVMRSA